MKKKIICLLALTPLVLAGCDKPSNGSEESSASSNRTGDFVSSVNPVDPKPDESESPIDPKPGNYDELTEAYFNELKAGALPSKVLSLGISPLKLPIAQLAEPIAQMRKLSLIALPVKLLAL